jgi:hypothetical protein
MLSRNPGSIPGSACIFFCFDRYNLLGIFRLEDRDTREIILDFS